MREDRRGARVLVTGGGTGGHVYPALALAAELVRRGTAHADILFVGSARGLEARAVPAAGFSIELLPGRGLQRSLSPRALAVNAGVVVGAAVALLRSWRLVRRHRPEVVVGVGGYASLPCVLAARLARVPVVVHEQNAAPGLANRIAVRLGATPAVTLPGTPLRGAVVVGNPVRAEMFALERHPDPDRPLVLAFGGSLGAGRINQAMVGLAGVWRGRADVRIHHVTGPRNLDACRSLLVTRRAEGSHGSDSLDYTLVGYEDAMERWYGQASVAVCRAGAVTVAELAAAGLPAVLVPLPGAPGDHQTRNAEALVAAGAAVLVADPECTTDRLAQELDGLLADPERLAAMEVAAGSLARPDAAARLADVVEQVARARP